MDSLFSFLLLVCVFCLAIMLSQLFTLMEKLLKQTRTLCDYLKYNPLKVGHIVFVDDSDEKQVKKDD